MAEGDLSMRELLERGILASIGMLSLTREKAQAAVDELVKRGEVKRSDSKGLVDHLVQRGDEERGSFRKLIHEEVGKVAHELNLVTKEDLKALEKKVEALSQKPQA
jgi:polyhydroxyalkanoate synthesis regulator phasin